ncbi:HPr family phosphocarrier protein [Priestia megaterium]|uniref:HPr family phosphocarrier protein n=1 Tax=Priestia megaterium TaxID=1404 RepID=UPI0017865BBD|nr:HPr family phosphocarrier protein [Priestia megaterium]MBD8847286.1 HPr family phosphocarrier protein [Priestia megaterium]
MLIKKLIVQLPRGLQARNTTIFVRLAFSFKSEIVLAKDGKTTVGRNIMGIMDLAIKEGDKITLMVDGIDEQAAIETLEKCLLNSSCIKI